MKFTSLAVMLVLFASTFVQAQTAGETIFKKNCVMCHGADGTGKTKMGQKLGAANLTSSDVQSLSDAAIMQTVEHGNGKMPAFEKTLSPEEIEQVVKYVRTLRK